MEKSLRQFVRDTAGYDRIRIGKRKRNGFDYSAILLDVNPNMVPQTIYDGFVPFRLDRFRIQLKFLNQGLKISSAHHLRRSRGNLLLHHGFEDEGSPSLWWHFRRID
jgi:hypothetical protein